MSNRSLPCSLIIFPILLALIAIAGKTTPGIKPGVVVLPQKHIIEIRTFEFQPRHLNILAGDTVVWVNYDIVPHTATAVDSSWDVQDIPKGMTSSEAFIADEAGTVAYFCRFHPAMRAVLNVE